LNQQVVWPLAVYGALVIGLVAFMMIASWLLGQRSKGKVTGEPYESGMPVTGSAHVRLSAQYYLVAMFFVVFDLETIFVLAWALVAREVGWQGYVEIIVFLGMQALALGYLWRLGALDWALRRHHQKPREK